jgi:hypothetical protein
MKTHFWDWFWDFGAGWVFGLVGVLTVLTPFMGFVFRSLVKNIIDEKLQTFKQDIEKISDNQNEIDKKLSAIDAELKLFLQTWNK